MPGSGAVLLVDDEALVRSSTADMLTELGYSVIEAESGEEALRLLDQQSPIDFLVTDHLMPRMTGTQLIAEDRRKRPGLSVLIISGYSEAEGIDPLLSRLTKPFRQAELGQCMAAIAASSALHG
ncbi:response regulator [Sphingomonas qilianensis]|uniref:Response regulator n=1 Tax=Sphingomonas qilianensis TaxID=1736690 RepID=A0ABU9XNT9_9SPHN